MNEPHILVPLVSIMNEFLKKYKSLSVHTQKIIYFMIKNYIGCKEKRQKN